MLYTVSDPEVSPVVLLQRESVEVKADFIKHEASKVGFKILCIDDIFPRDLKPVGAIIRDDSNSPLVERLNDIHCPIVQIGHPYFPP